MLNVGEAEQTVPCCSITPFGLHPPHGSYTRRKVVATVEAYLFRSRDAQFCLPFKFQLSMRSKTKTQKPSQALIPPGRGFLMPVFLPRRYASSHVISKSPICHQREQLSQGRLSPKRNYGQIHAQGVRELGLHYHLLHKKSFGIPPRSAQYMGTHSCFGPRWMMGSEAESLRVFMMI